MPSSVQPAQHTNVPSPVTIQSPMPIQPIAPQLANENLQVYIRRRKRQELEHGSQSTCGQYIDSNSSLPEENIDHPIGNYVTYEGLSPSYRAFATSLDDTQVPNTIQETLKISEWKKAVQDEIDALEKNGTGLSQICRLGRGLGCKWIFTIKYKADGSVERFKARLVARGILLSLAVNQDWCLQQLDIKNAFLNGDLEEEVYMEIPPGFEESMAKNQVCKLQKSLYGLKQSPEPVYVDDIILSGNDMEELQKLKKYLSEEFEVKDLGNLKYFLVRRNLVSRKKVHRRQGEISTACRALDLSLTYSARYWLCSECCKSIHAQPTEEHMEVVYRILRYLKMTPGKGLFFRKTENRDTEVYSDADWAGNIIDRWSTLDIVLLSGNLVTWRSKKQSVVTRSSAEAEYRALAQGISISIAKNPVHHDRTKHVEIDRHFITEKVTSETVKLNYVPTKHQTADILTKALPRPNFEDLTCKLGLYDIYSPA
ncbi:Retrovirus-related Pol polyprotein from transposon RE1 [Vitis vinifera]|uniref:Retrovirus-related Pol polyprotein from transposon RE1 n=1 Tax=Vitis vinifera TaxID=29760 RepID=A0A438F2K2_VITVI|nr:Retrovirus-related Pol polyprotein from transposon RE1 [Vitis vinifera]